MSGIALARVYRRFFESYPHVTLAVAGGALTALGDVVAQLSQQIVGVSRRKHPHNSSNISFFLRLHPKKMDAVGNLIMTFRAPFGFFALGQASVSKPRTLVMKHRTAGDRLWL
jgi:protein Mpv17